MLLSSEARMVTYVSKQNIRSEHSLEEVLQTGTVILHHRMTDRLHTILTHRAVALIFLILHFSGRTDIAKRLKYAKDIMYRLISTQAS